MKLVPGVQEYFENFVLLDIFMWLLDFIISSLHIACKVSTISLYPLEVVCDTLLRIPRSLEQPEILPM